MLQPRAHTHQRPGCRYYQPKHRAVVVRALWAIEPREVVGRAELVVVGVEHAPDHDDDVDEQCHEHRGVVPPALVQREVVLELGKDGVGHGPARRCGRAQRPQPLQLVLGLDHVDDAVGRAHKVAQLVHVEVARDVLAALQRMHRLEHLLARSGTARGQSLETVTRIARRHTAHARCHTYTHTSVNTHTTHAHTPPRAPARSWRRCAR